ncbi:MAG: DUF5908 family protein [Flavobacteriaceae bacterium]
MPIEINQLHIKVNVSSEDNAPERPNAKEAKKDREGIIAACVETVLDILNRKDDR